MPFAALREFAYTRHFMTLKPGTMIAMGTPGGLKNVNASDQVDISVSKIGSLSCHLVNTEEFYSK